MQRVWAKVCRAVCRGYGPRDAGGMQRVLVYGPWGAEGMGCQASNLTTSV